jgi:hypothetical protein
VDHKEQHHQHHEKERQEHIKEQKEHEHEHEKDLRVIHPKWLVVLGVLLTCGAVLAWFLFW